MPSRRTDNSAGSKIGTGGTVHLGKHHNSAPDNILSQERPFYIPEGEGQPSLGMRGGETTEEGEEHLEGTLGSLKNGSPYSSFGGCSM